MPPPRCDKNPRSQTKTALVKLGRRCPQFHAKQKGPQIPHLDLASLLQAYPYTTHKFTVKVTADRRGGCSWENVTKHYVGCIIERDILLIDIP